MEILFDTLQKCPVDELPCKYLNTQTCFRFCGFTNHLEMCVLHSRFGRQAYSDREKI